MRINRMEEGISREAIRCRAVGVPAARGRQIRSAITANDIACGIAFVWVVDPKLSVIEDVKGLNAELK